MRDLSQNSVILHCLAVPAIQGVYAPVNIPDTAIKLQSLWSAVVLSALWVISFTPRQHRFFATGKEAA